MVSRNMASPKFIFDGRNALDQVIIRAAGFEYAGVGSGAEPKDAGCGWRKVTRTGNTRMPVLEFPAGVSYGNYRNLRQLAAWSIRF